MHKAISLDEKVLLAAYDRDREGKNSFSAEDLVIAAWKKFPDSFGLEGYGEQYPDSNRVFTKIMGDKGLRGRGWLLKVGEKLYQLSDAGRLHASLLAEEDNPDASRASLNRNQKEALQRLLQSKATLKMKNDLRSEIIFLDACSFWDISPRSVANTLTARLTSIESLLDFSSQVIKDKGALTFAHGDIPVTEEDISVLSMTHQYLLERFQNELHLIRSRKDDRRSHR